MNMKFLEDIGLISYLGFAMATPIILGVIIGNYLDKIFKTSRVFFFIFMIFGVVASFVNMFQILGKYTKRK